MGRFLVFWLIKINFEKVSTSLPGVLPLEEFWFLSIPSSLFSEDHLPLLCPFWFRIFWGESHWSFPLEFKDLFLFVFRSSDALSPVLSTSVTFISPPWWSFRALFPYPHGSGVHPGNPEICFWSLCAPVLLLPCGLFFPFPKTNVWFPVPLSFPPTRIFSFFFVLRLSLFFFFFILSAFRLQILGSGRGISKLATGPGLSLSSSLPRPLWGAPARLWFTNPRFPPYFLRPKFELGPAGPFSRQGKKFFPFPPFQRMSGGSPYLVPLCAFAISLVSRCGLFDGFFSGGCFKSMQGPSSFFPFLLTRDCPRGFFCGFFFFWSLSWPPLWWQRLTWWYSPFSLQLFSWA